jgi:thioesterase domain-containing protein
MQPLDRDGLEVYLRSHIAPARALGLELLCVEPVTLAAPLAANLNDKGSVFAGSLFSAAALAGWLHLTRWCAARALQAEVVLQTAQTQFVAPARAAFRAAVREPAARQRERLEAMLARRGRGRIELAVEVSCETQLVMTLAGVYAVTQATARG